MKVASDFEVKHFIDYVKRESKLNDVILTIKDCIGDSYVTDMNGINFELNINVLPFISTSCEMLRIKNNIVH